MTRFSLDDPWSEDFDYSYDIGNTRSTEILKSINQFIGEVDSDSDNYGPKTIMEKLIDLQGRSYLETPQKNMYELIKILDKKKFGYPRQGDTFTFIYKARTPNLIYDLHPVSTIISLDKNKFVGFNHHLGMVRQYSGNMGRVLSNFYKIDSDELDIVLSIKTALLLKT
jgi:hypothetical protein